VKIVKGENEADYKVKTYVYSKEKQPNDPIEEIEYLILWQLRIGMWNYEDCEKDHAGRSLSN